MNYLSKLKTFVLLETFENEKDGHEVCVSLCWTETASQPEIKTFVK